MPPSEIEVLKRKLKVYRDICDREKKRRIKLEKAIRSALKDKYWLRSKKTLKEALE